MNTSGLTLRHIILIVVFSVLFFTGTALFALQAHAQTDTAANSDVSTDTSIDTPFRDRVEAERDRIQDARGTTLERRDQFRENVASRTDEVRDELRDRRDEIRDRLRDRIKNLLGNIKRRMSAAIERIGNIADRMESRIKKLEERGINVTGSLQFIDEARGELREASAIINSTTDAEVDTVIDSDKPRDAFISIKERIRKAAGHIRKAHQTLREAIAVLKEAVREAQDGGGVSDAVRSDGNDDVHVDGDEHDEHTDEE